jgi:hypothetical protein
VKTIIIHIGAHKTGTTYIQKCLYESREKLNKAKISYPNYGILGKTFGHHSIVNDIKNAETDTLKKLKDKIEHTLNENNTLVLSSENFEYLNSKEIETLRQLFPSDCLTKIIYYHRQPYTLIPSLWQEEVKHGYTKSFHHYFNRHLLTPFKSHIINSNLILDKFSECFFKENIYIVSYDYLKKKGIDVLTYFDNNFIKANVHPLNNIINKSLDAIDVELIRLFNHIHFRKTQESGYKIRLAYQALKPISEELKLLGNSIEKFKYRVNIPKKCFIFDALNTHLNNHYSSRIVTETNIPEPVQKQDYKTLNLISSDYQTLPTNHDSIQNSYSKINDFLQKNKDMLSV